MILVKTTTRTYDNPTAAPGGNFSEHTYGDAPSSVELSLNSKGQVQWSVKLYYPSPSDAKNNVAGDLTCIDEEIKTFLSSGGYTLAGK